MYVFKKFNPIFCYRTLDILNSRSSHNTFQHWYIQIEPHLLPPSSLRYTGTGIQPPPSPWTPAQILPWSACVSSMGGSQCCPPSFKCAVPGYGQPTGPGWGSLGLRDIYCEQLPFVWTSIGVGPWWASFWCQLGLFWGHSSTSEVSNQSALIKSSPTPHHTLHLHTCFVPS